jgi:hypothetical protein
MFEHRLRNGAAVEFTNGDGDLRAQPELQASSDVCILPGL